MQTVLSKGYRVSGRGGGGGVCHVPCFTFRNSFREALVCLKQCDALYPIH